LAPESVRVKYYMGGGGFGRGGAPGVAWRESVGSAALISQLAGRPVRLQYMRWDDFGWNFYGEATLYDVRAGVDANGNLVAVDITSIRPAMIAAGTETEAGNAVQQMVGLPLAREAGPGFSALGSAAYHRPAARETMKTLPLENNYFKTTYLRAPGTPQAGWAFEQVIDELAYAAKKDPIEFRRQNITRENRPDRSLRGSRYLALLDAVSSSAKWQPRVAASRLSNAPVVTGRGVALGTYGASSLSAAVAIVEVNKRTGRVVAKDLVQYQAGD
jgi:CO/xanthine dehydrogenase Mo-binding subunit